MKRGLIKILLFLSITFTSISLISCNNVSKKITVSENTEDVIALEESEVIKAISSGEKLLDENKLDEAKDYFNKAISLEKENKDTYIRIKDKYVSINKLDEAYNIIKIAISNNVDVDNMNLLLKEISSKFEVIKISNSLYQGTNYTLPNEVDINISDTSITIPISWNNEIVDTTAIGTSTYEGYNDKYGRKVILELTVIENIYDKQIGSIKDIYNKDGKTYIDVDLVEFYFNTENENIALNEALKDNRNDLIGHNENGDQFIVNGYYIRNNSSKITTYEISKDCSFQLLYDDLIALGYNDIPASDSTTNHLSSYNDFKKYIDNRNSINKSEIITDLMATKSTLFWIELKNNNAYSIYKQFTP